VSDKPSTSDVASDMGKIRNEINGVAAGSVVQTGAVHGDVNIHHTTPKSATLVPHQLPRTVRHFTNRHDEQDALTALLDAAEQTKTMVISAVNGTAGIGKTTLALYWGHQVRDRFQDGELYVDLRGFSPAAEPMPAGEVLRGFLDALGVSSERIPEDTDARAALYRSMVYGRRMLVVLDNALNSEQVRPLLPGSPTCLVLVTSRNQLDGLVIRDGARRMTLDFLTTPQALALLISYLGGNRVEAESDAVSELIERCAHLPLALSIVAADAARHPTFPLAALAEELRNEQDLLDVLEVGDDAGVRTVFSWSYRALSAEARRMFRLICLPAGADISLGAAAALAGLPTRRARKVLDELIRVHVLEHHVPGRYRLHDLLRAYAAERAEHDEPDTERHTALCRILDWYLHSSHHAGSHLNPHLLPIILNTPHPDITPREISDLQAMDWFTTERACLLAATKLAGSQRFDRHAWQLPAILHAFLERQGHWHDCASAHETALDAARRVGHQHAQALTCLNLGRAHTRLRRYDDAFEYYQQGLTLFREVGDSTGQAHTHYYLSILSDLNGRYSEALTHAQHALNLFRTAGDRAGQASALEQVGWDHAQLGHYEQAIAYCEEALPLLHRFAERHREADTHDSLGYAHHRLGHHTEAIVHYQQAITLWRILGDHYNKAKTLTRLGDTYRASGNDGSAAEAWGEALAVFRELDPPDAENVQAKLADLETDAQTG
jgi:tetratricopeptide (TPR) repeat protein